ncbi:MAG TPA: O-antigen ligase family protein [Anaerolineae bacterium]|nr:O-antigen ligase family protein [Anaerolineae bacterium]
MRYRIAYWLERLSVWGLVALLVTLPFWRHRVLIHRPAEPVFFEFRDVILYTNDLLWWGAVGAWLLSGLLGRTWTRWRLGPMFLTGPLVGLLLLGAAGIPSAVDPFFAGYQTLRLVLLLALYFLVLNLPLTSGTVAWPLAAGLTVQAVVGVPQFFLGRSLGLKRMGEVAVKAAWPGAGVVMVGEERWLRAYGMTQHPNLLGGLVVVMMLVVTGYYLWQSGWRRITLLVALGVGLATALFTFSRSAWLGGLLGGLVLVAALLWAWRRRQWSPNWPTVALLSAVSLGVVTAFLISYWPLLRPRLGLVQQGVEIRSVDARVMQSEAAKVLIWMRPVLGVGLGNYPIALYELAPETVAEYPVYQPVHNVLLLSTAELGPLGGLLWLCLAASPWLALWLRRRQVWMEPWWAGVSGALAALMVVSFFDQYVWSSNQGRLLLWLVLGLWAREWEKSRLKG